ncbi:ABC-type cobalt transport system substrate-binding protein [Bradyrhizobium sp. cir1]|uniref:NYN domain-containing protein n=1 Tax=Bradyrhizobium sp. cir1 TaxID=1445730 RepID=UPI0016057298|nr:NYN domain-containing protein [Bradyrhizobium sp. cir1]MBB4370109.1 ABC-type cobalt transport system substrate-binding protein [Bradyrhizobium sp. cir1]
MTKYLFIDGACLRTTIEEIGKRYAPGQVLRVDYDRLTGGYDKVFYYDALPAKRSGETDEDFSIRRDAAISFHDQLGSLDRFHVYEGDTRKSPSARKQEQKKVDVMIAVDMLTHSFRRNMQHATLLTGDLDFKPLLDALVLEGMSVTLWFPPHKTNKQLIAAADQRRQLDIQSIYPALKPVSKALFSIPSGSGEPSRGDIGRVLHASNSDDGESKLFECQDRTYVFAAPNPNPGYCTYWTHTDLTILKHFAFDVFGFAVPDTVA